jgi:hypothetical protein
MGREEKREKREEKGEKREERRERREERGEKREEKRKRREKRGDKCKKPHARVFVKAKTATKIEMTIGQNVTAMGWYSGSMYHTVTRCPLFPPIFRADEQSVHFGSEYHSSKTLQG